MEKILEPKLRFPEFSGEWQVKKLGDISQSVMYGMNAAAKEFDGINKYIRITDIDENSNKYNPSPEVSPEGEIEEKFKVKENDLLFARTGASTGKSYLYNKDDGNLYFAGFLIKLNIKQENSSNYIFQNTLTNKYKNWVKVMSMRSGQPGINAEEYKGFELNIPPLPEQEKIASFLSSVDSKIEKLEKKRELLSQYKKGITQKIFSQEIRFKDDDGNDYPQWEEKKLGELVKINMGQSPDSKSYNEDKIGLPLIQGNADIQNRVSKPRNYTSSPTKTCDIEDIIMTVRAPVGYIAKSLHSACIGRGVCSIKAPNDFIYQYLLSYEDKWEKYSQGSTFTAVNSSDVKGLKLLSPCLEEQEKIANFLSSIDKKIELVERETEKNKEFKKGLLQQMFV